MNLKKLFLAIRFLCYGSGGGHALRWRLLRLRHGKWRMVWEHVIIGLVAGVGRRFPSETHLSEEGVMRMFACDFVEILSLCMTAFALGFTIGSQHKK